MLPSGHPYVTQAYTEYGSAPPGPHVYGVGAATYRGLLEVRVRVRARARARVRVRVRVRVRLGLGLR